MSTKLVKYTADSGYEVTLTEDIVRTALTRGNSAVSPKEIFLYVKMCEARKINPFVGEAFLVKYGKQDAQMVVSKDFWLKKLKAVEGYRWHSAGVLVATKSNEPGQVVITEHEGTFFNKANSELVGGWARVQIGEHMFYHDVGLDEFHKGQSTWNQMPAVMIRKVAIAQLSREVAPEQFGSMYLEEEIPRNVTKTAVDPKELNAVRTEIAKLQGGKYTEQALGMTDLEALKALLNSLLEAENGK